MNANGSTFRYTNEFRCKCGAPMASFSFGVDAETGKRRASGICEKGHQFEVTGGGILPVTQEMKLTEAPG